MYRTMVTARLVDEAAFRLNRQGKAPFVVPVSGHEGCQVGTGWPLRPGQDIWVPYYRDVAIVLIAGMTPYEIFLGLFAKAEDPSSGGRQMPSHWGSRRLGIISHSSPIATQIPHAAGIAYAAKYRGEDAVVGCWFGEGATSAGAWHEGLNFAGIHKLPVVFVCENNYYAISVGQPLQMAIENVADRAAGYGFPGVVVDGNDVLASFAAMKTAVERARAGEGPTLIEAKTYRFFPHTSDDDDRSYRSREEVQTRQGARPDHPLRRHARRPRRPGCRTDRRAVVRDQGGRRQPDRSGLERGRSRSFHPRSSRVLRTGRRVTEKNVVTAIHDTLHDEMAANERVVVLGEDIATRGGVFRVTQGFLAEFGEQRVIDTPLAEAGIIGIAVGMALHGLLPVAEIEFADFIHPAYDQMVSEVARMRYRSNGDFGLPMVVRAPWGGGVHGALYHSQSIEATYGHVPGLKVVVPGTPYDASGMLRAAIKDPDPVLFLEHKRTYRLIKGEVPDEPFEVPLGTADVKREGEDLTAVAYGLSLHLCLEAASRLQDEQGVSVEVVDVRTISPLDKETILASVRKTGKAMVVYEDNRTYGAGAEIAATIAEEAMFDLDGPIVRIGGPDVPAMGFASNLEHAFMLNADEIGERMLELARF